MTVATFQLPGKDVTAIVASLAELGFVFGPPRTLTTTLVDTFDGRLHRSGLRLELRTSEGIELVLSGADVVPAHLLLDTAPAVVADLAPGPFRSRVASLVGIRALLPQIRVRMEQSAGTWRDGTDKTVAVAELNERVHVVNGADTGLFGTIEIHEVPGYAKQTRRALEVLRRAGLAECSVDTLTQCAEAADVDLAGFKATATVPLHAPMAAIDGVRAVLANLEVAISANWRGAIDNVDTKFLHDLRIAVRRTRTVLAASKAVIPADVLDPASEGFKWLAGATGAARDLDVYLLEWEQYTAPLGVDTATALESVRDLLTRHHRNAHVALSQVLESDRASALITDWRGWLDTPVDDDGLPRRAGHPIGKVVARRIARAHDALIDEGRLIGPDTPADDVHDLRKDAKKLRYLIECFSSILPDKSRKKYVKQLKALQENLGEHQDAEVHIALLRSITPELVSAEADANTMVAIGELIQRLEQTRLAARTEFAERFADYDSAATQHSFDALIEAISQ
ncbi:CHAD domain-containing protein [Ilumatobacter sp.]|uniref:CHAD domain-containing protein n=1 Tax=Ilumatobacter sp. TaxID=1967498 RepID=UPI0037518CD4